MLSQQRGSRGLFLDRLLFLDPLIQPDELYLIALAGAVASHAVGAWHAHDALIASHLFAELFTHLGTQGGCYVGAVRWARSQGIHDQTGQVFGFFPGNAEASHDPQRVGNTVALEGSDVERELVGWNQMQCLPHQMGLDQSLVLPKRVLDLDSGQRVVACPKLQIRRPHDLRLRAADVPAYRNRIRIRAIEQVMTGEAEACDLERAGWPLRQIHHSHRSSQPWFESEQ